MKARRTTYVMHRWLGLLVSLQLLAWSLGGFVFSVLEIEAVRGEQDSTGTGVRPLRTANLPESVAALRHAVTGSVTLVDRGVGPRWEVRTPSGELLACLDSRTGLPAPRLTAEQAEAIARSDTLGSPAVVAATLVESDPPVEYRGRPLPAWRVVLDHPRRPHLYIDARTGQITARRNRLWRVFDFFWMLHTMDYRGRDDFNHLLLTGFSLLAIATSSSGILLWVWRFVSRRRSRRHGMRAQAD